MAELELAAAVVAWLKAQHWEVYQEVQCEMYGPTADIVGLQGPASWVVEAKATLSLALIEQAMQWNGRAHFVSVAVPDSPSRQSRGRRAAERFLRREGIGLLCISRGGWVAQSLEAGMNRRLIPTLEVARFCNEAQRDWAPAGNADGLRWTPYQETCRAVARYVSEHPGCSIREAIEHTRHHYASDVSARSCLLKWINQGKVRGVRAVAEGRRILLYPAEVVHA